MEITVEILAEKEACKDMVVEFAKAFPDGYEYDEWTEWMQGCILAHPKLRKGWSMGSRAWAIPCITVSA